MAIPIAETYWLQRARIPACFLAENVPIEPFELVRPRDRDSGSIAIDLQISAGRVTQILPADTAEINSQPAVDLRHGQIWPCFVDLHTHLDKGHIWPRTDNPDGSFDGALTASLQDAAAYWTAEDVYQRLEFGLRCSYAHGTQAIRTHIDARAPQGEISLEVFASLRAAWADRLKLQAVSLVTLDYFQTAEGERLADRMAEVSGLLGGVAYMHPEIEAQLDRTFALAQARGLDLDFHADETGDSNAIALRKIAEAALRHQFTGQIVCGHCCSLAQQSEAAVAETLALVKEAGIGIVSLPMCNLYLQDRQPGHTPRWRGVTLLHECQQAGIPVAVASDNCRDPFYGFGDHDVLEVFEQSVRIAHLDRPYGNWPRAVTTTPARLMGLTQIGEIGLGYPADLVLFKGRNFSELLSRSQHDRIVLRNGRAIDTTLPDYAELDDLLEQGERR